MCFCMHSWNNHILPLDGDRVVDPCAKPPLLMLHELLNWCTCQWCQLACVSSPHTHTTSNITVGPYWLSLLFFSIWCCIFLFFCRMPVTPLPLSSSWAHWTRTMMESSTSWSSGSWLGILQANMGGSANRVSSDTLFQLLLCYWLVSEPYSFRKWENSQVENTLKCFNCEMLCFYQ